MLLLIQVIVPGLPGPLPGPGEGANHNCGCVLVDDEYLLTAAHCVEDYDMLVTVMLSNVSFGE